MNNQKENPGHGVAGESSVLLTQSHTTNSSTSLDDLLTASVDNYLRHGWKLCVVPPGSKGPATTGWNKPENAVTRAEQVPTHHGVGLLHAQSGSMALDIDDWGNAVTKLQEHGIDLNQLYQAPDAVIIDSGNPGHGKLLYRMPHGVILPTKKITEGRTTLYELRCATTNGLSVQDVLPPTIHPGTNQPYRWAGHGHWSRLPEIPEQLLIFWQGLIDQDSHRVIPSGDQLNASWDEIKSALYRIPPDIDRDSWVAIGMALNWAGTQTGQEEDAFYLWDQWSQGTPMAPCTKYRGQQDLVAPWRSFRPESGRTIATLFGIAKEHGWKRPQPTADEIFKGVGWPEPLNIFSPLGNEGSGFNPEHWPQVIAAQAEEVSKRTGADSLLAAASALAHTVPVCHDAHRIQPKKHDESWTERPCLWLTTVGPPSAKKSPTDSYHARPLKNAEELLAKDYEHKYAQYQNELTLYQVQKKCWERDAKKSDTGKEVASAMLSMPQEPQKPDFKRYTVQDITLEKLADVCSQNNGGIAVMMDELTGWFGSMDAYKNGGKDRPAYLSAYNGSLYTVDRKSGTTHIDNWSVSIYGGIQPRKLGDLLKKSSEDGLIQRFAIVHVGEAGPGLDIPQDMAVQGRYDAVINRLATDYKTLEDYPSVLTPRFQYRLSEDAQHIADEARKKIEGLAYLDFPTAVVEALSKAVAQMFRIALVFHLIECVDTSEAMPQPLVQADTMGRASRLMLECLIPSMVNFYLEHVDHGSDSRWIASHIISRDPPIERITEREIYRYHNRIGKLDSEYRKRAIADAMEALELAEWVNPVEAPRGKHVSEWIINPRVNVVFDERGKRERERRESVKARIRDAGIARKRGEGKSVTNVT